MFAPRARGVGFRRARDVRDTPMAVAESGLGATPRVDHTHAPQRTLGF